MLFKKNDKKLQFELLLDRYGNACNNHYKTEKMKITNIKNRNKDKHNKSEKRETTKTVIIQQQNERHYRNKNTEKTKIAFIKQHN